MLKDFLNQKSGCDKIHGCQLKFYSPAKCLLWGGIASFSVILPQVFDQFEAANLTDLQKIRNLSGWVIVWIMTLALVAHERLNNIFILLVHSFGVPGTIVGLGSILAV